MTGDRGQGIRASRRRWIATLAVVLGLGSCVTTPAPAGSAQVVGGAPAPDTTAERTIWDGVFSLQQARQGERVAESQCALCHSVDIEWTLIVPRWSGRTLGDLYTYISTEMPENFPGGLARQEYADIIAYMLRLSGAPPGDSGLSSRQEDLAGILIEERTR